MKILVCLPDYTTEIEIDGYRTLKSGESKYCFRKIFSGKKLQDMIVKDEPCEYCYNPMLTSSILEIFEGEDETQDTFTETEIPRNYCPLCGRQLSTKK